MDLKKVDLLAINWGKLSKDWFFIFFSMTTFRVKDVTSLCVQGEHLSN